jgi:hypothetical protein
MNELEQLFYNYTFGVLAFRMATRKRKCTGGLDPNSLRMKLLRVAETPQQRQARLEQNRTRNAEARYNCIQFFKSAIESLS